jgi:subtilisin family serine protease
MLCSLCSIAQSKNNKLSIGLHQLIKQNAASKTMESYPVLIRAHVEKAAAFITQHGGTVKYKTKNILSADVNDVLIELLNEQDFVYWIDCPRGKLLPLNDVMTVHNNIDSAYFGVWPLDQGYDGTGVIIGIIDAPFDYKHGDFTDALGNTRIKYLWDQTTEGIHPASFPYGNECDSTQLAEGTCMHEDVEGYYSHGTGVAGTAAGSGNASGNYRGAAPNADLIFVSLDFGSEFLSNTVDAIAYIFEKADAMGKPCVINTSFGSYAGSHDGKDITSQAIAELLNEKPGRVLVAAAGNAGNQKLHLNYDVTSTPKFTWFKKLSYTNAVYYQLWADSADFDGVYFSISADDPATYVSKGSTPLYNILSDYDVSAGMIDGTYYEIYEGSVLIGTVETAAQNLNGVYFLEVYIVPSDPSYYWRFTTSGEGTFDIWSTEAFTGFSNYVTILPDVSLLPDIAYYEMPDTDETTVGYWQCLDEVITVGSYVNRDTMTNYYGTYPTLIDTVGQLFYSSSHGPTRDNRIKPDITATGARVLSSGSHVLTEWLISLEVADYISQDGMHYLQNGTSFASPCVTGAAALYLQKHPDANWSEVKHAMLDAAKSDSYTGYALPDNRWGYGKLNAFRALTGSWGCTADDYTNPPENLAVPVVSATAAYAEWDLIPNASGYQLQYQNLTTLAITKKTSAVNYKTLTGLSPATNYALRIRARCDDFGFSHWSGFTYFTTPALKEEAETPAITMYPNPANETIFIHGLPLGFYELSCINVTGKTVLRKNIEVTQGYIETDVSVLNNGMYSILLTNGRFAVIKQFIIAE